MPARTALLTNLGGPTVRAPEMHPGKSPRATGIRDVAVAAGVSTATVSRALRGLPRVSQSTRQRIQAAASDLGYVPSSAASELARGRGTRRATPPEQLKRVAPFGSNTEEFPVAGPCEVSDRPVSPSRGTILVVIGPLTGSGTPAPTEIEQLVRSVASAHGFTACIKSCNEADILDTVTAAAASFVGIIINAGGLSPTPAELLYAVASAHIPTVEVHTSNTCFQRDNLCAAPQSSACTVMISGAGIHGFKLAVDYLGTAV